MAQVASRIEMEWKIDALNPFLTIKLVGGMYLPHHDHQEAKKKGKAFTVSRATIKSKWEWLDPGFGKLGADFHLDYIDSHGRYHRVDTVDYLGYNAPIQRERDVTDAFSPGNFGVNILVVSGATHGDFPWNTDSFKAEHILTVTYGVGG